MPENTHCPGCGCNLAGKPASSYRDSSTWFCTACWPKFNYFKADRTRSGDGMLPSEDSTPLPEAFITTVSGRAARKKQTRKERMNDNTRCAACGCHREVTTAGPRTGSGPWYCDRCFHQASSEQIGQKMHTQHGHSSEPEAVSLPTHFITTVSGRSIDLLEPKPEQFEVHDLAWSLSMQPRYNGHTEQFYSVAEHSVLVSLTAPKNAFDPKLKSRYALLALLHDAHEAVTGDIPAPVKKLLGDSIGDLENRLDIAIRCRFGLVHVDSAALAAVKNADLAVGAMECRQLSIPVTPGRAHEPADLLRVEFWPQAVAYQRFLDELIRLMKEAKRG